jgi:Zn-dependent protease with chaperone function
VIDPIGGRHSDDDLGADDGPALLAAAEDGDAMAMAAVARSLEDAGEITAAERWWNLAALFGEPDALLAMAWDARNRDDRDAALALVRRVARDTDPDVLLAAGYALDDLDDWAGARRCFERVARGADGDVERLLPFAGWLLESGEYETGEAWMRVAYGLQSDEVAIVDGLAVLVEARGADDEAEQLWARAESLGSDIRGCRRREQIAWAVTWYAPVPVAAAVMANSATMGGLLAIAAVVGGWVAVSVVAVVALARTESGSWRPGRPDPELLRAWMSTAWVVVATAFTCLVGAIAAPLATLGPLLAGRLSVWAADDVDPDSLPPEARAVIDRAPGHRIKVDETLSTVGLGGRAMPRRRVYVSPEVLGGNPDRLAYVLAHEFAHHRDGIVRGVLANAGWSGAAGIVGAAAAVVLGFAAVVGVPDGVDFGRQFTGTFLAMHVASAFIMPFALAASRRREARVERIALEILPDPGYMLTSLRYGEGVGAVPAWYRVLARDYPDRDTYRRIGADYAARLTDAGASRR